MTEQEFIAIVCSVRPIEGADLDLPAQHLRTGFWLRPRKRFEGQVMLAFIALYAVLRFVLEFWRADERGELLGLSTSQLLAVPALLLVAGLWQRWRRR